MKIEIEFEEVERLKYKINSLTKDNVAIRWFINENIDESLLLPLVILHDVGYANVPSYDPYNLNTRKKHMREGAKIAKILLKKLNYQKKM